jgi:hypothetical protein
MTNWQLWYRDDVVGYIMFSENVSEDAMFDFLAYLGVKVSFLYRVGW